MNQDTPLPPSSFQSGGGGIRTRERLSTLVVFKTTAFGRSATPPRLACSLILTKRRLRANEAVGTGFLL